MNIAVNTFAYQRPLGLVRCLKGAVSSQHDVTYHISQHSQQEGVQATCEALARWPNVRLYLYGYNRGLAKSINDVMENAFDEGADLVVNINDDCLVNPDTLDSLATAAQGNPEAYAVFAHLMQRDKPEWSWYGLVAFTRLAWETLGCFDENFFPAYFEDNDYHCRARMSRLSWVTVPDVLGSHIGSATLAANSDLKTQNDVTFPLNREYYIRKWGGCPGEETFTQPFGMFSNRIDPHQRHTPYGELHDRHDQELVKL